MLDEDLIGSLEALCSVVLGPLSDLFLKSGATYKDFSQLAKQSFVEEASSKYGEKDRPANMSRIALLTGLSRKEVARIKNLEVREEVDFKVTNRCSEILSIWHLDNLYLGANGVPKPLGLESGSENISFKSLVDKVGVDLPYMAILKELIDSNSIVKSEDDLYYPIARHYVPYKYSSSHLLSVATQIRDILNTCFPDYSNNDSLPNVYKRSLFTDSEISKEDYKEFFEITEKKMFKLLHEVDDWLESKRVRDKSDTVRVGFGSYQFSE